MSRIDEINAMIQGLENKVREYNGIILELRKAYEYISERKTDIEKDFYDPVYCFDMTRSDEWRGEREKEGENQQNEICDQTRLGLTDTARLLDDILNAIENLEELIRQCNEEIAGLQAELDVLMAMEGD